MRLEQKDIKNILVVRNDRFGEFLLNIPALRALKETFVNSRLIIVIDPYVRELAESISYVDEVIEWGRVKHTLSEKVNLIKILRKKRINIVIILNPSKEMNILTYLSGIPIRVGYARKWGFLLTHKKEDKKYLGQRHEVEYNLELVGLVGAKTENQTLSLAINNDVPKDFNIENYENLMALNPWTSDPVKQWPADNFRELTKRLIRELNIKIVIIGGKEEFKRSIDLFDNFDNNLFNLTGRTTLKQLAALIKKCKLLVSGDSGPVHLASAVGTPVVAIFRNDIPAKSARRWGPWGEGNIVIEKERLSDITVDEVFNRVRRAFKK